MGSPSSRPQYRLSDFDFELPPELIAQRPPDIRSSSRLLHVDREVLQDLSFKQLPRLVAPGDVMVFNDTRVMRSRVFGRKPTGGKVELMLERVVAPDQAWMQCGASHVPRVGSRIQVPGDATATVIERDGRFLLLRFDDGVSVIDYLDRHGEMPLPPYITRAPDALDDTRYQTVYARHAGAVAAPTAGLHFDTPMLDALHRRGVESVYITLHVGAGTFLPVDGEDLSRHRMHVESFIVPPETVKSIAAARQRGNRIVAVGTTSLRAIESAAADGTLRAGSADTDLFITPGFGFRVIDRLLTNFHLPRSTLLMLVSAFAGYDNIRAAYRHAISHRYRFFSYGDAMLLERAAPTPPPT